MPEPEGAALVAGAHPPATAASAWRRLLDLPRPRVPRLGVRAHAFLLVLAVAAPLGALLVTALRQIAVQDEENAAAAVRQVARTAAAEADLFLGEARAELDQIATRPGIRVVDSARCEAALSDSAAARSGVLRLLLVDLAGRAVCRTTALPGDPRAYAQRPWFNAIVHGGARYAVDAPRRSRVDQRWVVTLAVPVRRADGTVAGVLAGALDLARLPTPDVGREELPASSAVDLVDRRALLVAGSAGTTAVGTRLNGGLVQQILAGHGGVVRGASYDGVDKVVGYAPLATAPWVAMVSTPADAVLAESRRSAMDNMLAVAAILGAILLGAALVARRMLRPIDSIADVAHRVAGGDLSARARETGPRELADIAREVNRMLEQRQRDETALRDSELRFRQLFETSSDAIVMLDADSRIVFAYAAVQQVFGYRPTSLAGREVSLLLTPAAGDTLAGCMRAKAYPGGLPEADATEVEGRHEDGRPLAFEMTLSHLRLAGSDMFAVFLRDIGARKRAEAELRDSEARFRQLADSAPSLIWMSTADGNCFYLNRRWLEFTGRTLEQSCGHGWAAAVHPEDRAHVLDRNEAAFDATAPFSVEYRLRRHDGEYRWMLNHGTPRLARDGTLMGYIGTCIDIHDRVAAERRIRRLSTLYAALSKANEAMARTRATAELLQQVCDIAVEHGRFAVATVGLVEPDGGHARLVASAGDTLGCFEGNMLSLAPDAPRRNAPSVIAMRENRPFISNDRNHDSRTLPLENRAARVLIHSSAALPLHRDGQVTGFLTVHATELDYFDDEMVELLGLLAADLSFALDTMAGNARREEAEAALRQLNATLEAKVEERTRSLQAANRELEAFSYSVSHDLRAPLRAITGFAQMIAEEHGERLDREARGYLERVRAAASRMSRLIDDLMNLCRIARMSLTREPLDLSRMAAEVMAELQEGDPQRAVQVRITPALSAQADRGLVQIVLSNLLGNAWKFTARSARPAIAFGAGEHAGVPAFYVRDNGAGFDMQHAEKLFTPFQRLHSEQEFAGTGIGLAMVQRIVERHGGSVAAQSTLGEGTTIWFTLDGATERGQ
jgi:PAS domain S-box-containing protein